MRNTANPTRLSAGYKENVIPGRASATVDCRTLPGQSERFLEQLRAIIGPDIDIEFIQHQPAVETSFDGPLVDAMAAALRAEDPGARADAVHALRRVPTPRRSTSSASAASASPRCGCRADLNFAALFHGIDERVPVEGLQFGVRVLDRFLARC